jgi:tetratricopeptide (TPR) repeat protein
LAVCYPYAAATPEIESVGAGLLIAVITFLAVRLATRRPYFLVGWLWYLGTLVPVIGLVQVGDQAWADRYAYLPLVGLFISFVWGLSELLSRITHHASRLLLPALAGAAALGLLAGTTLQLRYWKNTRALFEHSAEVTRNNGRALDVLGSLLAEQGKLPEAMVLYTQALSIRADDPEAHFLMGSALEGQGKPDAAVAEYTQALWFKPLEEKVRISLGFALAKQKNYDAAAAQYRAALALDPESALAHNNLARLLQTQGHLDEAIEHYSDTVKIDPSLAQAHNNLGVLLLQKGRIAEGADHLKEAVRLKPGDPESEYNLAAALNQQEQWQAAADIFSRLADRRPDDANLHCQYGLALAHLQKTREAMSQYAEALLRQPNFPEALNGLAWILATDPHAEIRNGSEAVRMAEGACDLTGHQRPVLLMTLAAAYAEAARFSDAVAAAKKAQLLAVAADQRQIAVQCESLLQTLKLGKPWREMMH